MKNAIQMMESKMSPEMVKKAHKQAEQEILAILREEQNIKQTNLKNFSQSSVSKIEKRKDMKISTLVSYLDSIRMGVEIKAYAKDSSMKIKEKILIKV